ncbi:hypothetical protein J5N97_002213 [Dioscorea zingiberensis]|uniref:RING-type domain-containing protein n=1 Tax=Dioscorea zingiberensis TaxID=325984 RepID=A0A9D5D3N6_9LILI|nr:hypothetical protein J5N97_002213 [Dioscorea zingiberensis]
MHDSKANDSSVSANARDFAKKRRVNRSAKLKQCKLDARREQWLSQVKGNSCKVTPMASPPTSSSPPVSMPRPQSCLHDSDMVFPAHIPISNSSGNTPKVGCCLNNSVSRGGSTRSCSLSASDGEEEGGRGEDNVALDDWEAVADALSAYKVNDGCHPSHDTGGTFVESHVPPAPVNDPCVQSTMKPEATRTIPRAWRPDDVFRPQSLPNLYKHQSFPTNMERHFGAKVWSHPVILSAPSSCPICYEDLDPTDSSFLPCDCGFRLCLFCHKRILEADCRCPGCRKQYSPVEGEKMDMSGVAPLIPFQLSRSCSMSSRS